MENQTGKHTFLINGKEWYFKFGMNAYEILFEQNDFVELSKAGKTISVAKLCFYAGAKCQRTQNGLPTNWTLEDAGDFIEEMNDFETLNEIYLACLDSMGFMFRITGKNPEAVKAAEQMAKKVREVLEEAIREQELSNLKPSKKQPTS